MGISFTVWYVKSNIEEIIKKMTLQNIKAPKYYYNCLVLKLVIPHRLFLNFQHGNQLARGGTFRCAGWNQFGPVILARPILFSLGCAQKYILSLMRWQTLIPHISCTSKTVSQQIILDCFGVLNLVKQKLNNKELRPCHSMLLIKKFCRNL